MSWNNIGFVLLATIVVGGPAHAQNATDPLEKMHAAQIVAQDPTMHRISASGAANPTGGPKDAYFESRGGDEPKRAGFVSDDARADGRVGPNGQWLATIGLDTAVRSAGVAGWLVYQPGRKTHIALLPGTRDEPPRFVGGALQLLDPDFDPSEPRASQTKWHVTLYTWQGGKLVKGETRHIVTQDRAPDGDLLQSPNETSAF